MQIHAMRRRASLPIQSIGCPTDPIRDRKLTYNVN